MKLGKLIKHRKGFITINDEDEYKLCRVQVHRRGVVLREIVKGKAIKTKKQQVCKAGDFLVAEMDAKVGGYGFVPDELDGAIVSSHYFLFELDQSKIRPKFLELISKLQILQDQIKAIGSTNYAAIRPVNVLDWEIPYVKIDKQIEIERLFTSASDNNYQLENQFIAQQDLVKQLRQAFLREAMQGKLVKQDAAEGNAAELLKQIKAEKEKLIAEKRPKKEKELPPINPEEIPFDIPENWVWCRLGEIAQTANNGIYKPESFYQESGYISLRMFNIQDGKIDLKKTRRIVLTEKELKNYLLQENDILVNRVNSQELVGKAALIHTVDEPMVFESMNIRLRLIFKDCIAKFINYNLFDERARNYFYSSAKIANGQVSINQTQLFEFLVPLPPLSEQHRIAQNLDELMQLCDGLQASIQASQQQNNMLLQVALRDALNVNRG